VDDVWVVVVERVVVVLPELAPVPDQVSPKLKERAEAVGAGVNVRRAATVSLRRALATSCGALTVDLAEAVKEELDVLADRAAEPFALVKRFALASKVSLELLLALLAEEESVRETCAGLAAETRESPSAPAGADFSIFH
jgi:hypothetical protein